jgi:hypothetical protein
VDIAGVNIMTMDYYDGVNYDGINGHPSMGDAAISAAQGLFGQLKNQLNNHGLFPPDAEVWQMIGITPQIGVNVPTGDQAQSGVENFTLNDASEVTAFARQQGVGRLSMWSLNKDQYVPGEGPDQIWEDTSSNPQQPFDYAKTFEQFTGSGGVNQPPTITNPAGASPNLVRGKTTTLSVLGNDDGGADNLTYTWTTIGRSPAPVAFTVNGSNAARNTTAIFRKAGTYTLLVTVTDAFGLSTTSAVTVTVKQTLTRVVVRPPSARIRPGMFVSLLPQARDQFALPLAVQPRFVWTVISGGGTVSPTGVYRAPKSRAIARVKATPRGFKLFALATIFFLS